MDALGWEMWQEPSYFAAFGHLDWFNAEKKLYDYDEVQVAAGRIEKLWENRVENPAMSVKNPEQVRNIFRFYPHQIKQICELLQVDLEPKTKRSNPISVPLQVCTALQYYATGKLIFFKVLDRVFCRHICAQMILSSARSRTQISTSRHAITHLFSFNYFCHFRSIHECYR